MIARERALEPVDLIALGAAVLASAQSASAKRSARTVHGGNGMLRQTMFALAGGAELAEHESPPEATLQVLVGNIRLHGQGRSWELRAGQIIPIPPARHSVSAVEDSVFLLTIRRDADPTIADHQGPKL